MYGNSLHVADNFMQTVLLECINESTSMLYHTVTVLLDHKCLMLLLTFVLHFTIMLALCLMLSITQYAQNYAGIIGRVGLYSQ